MLPIDPNHHAGMICPKCGWGWATSFIEPIAEDAVDYTVILLAENVPTKETIKTVAGIAGINYLQARRMIKTAPQKLFVGKAMSVKSVLTALEASSIKNDTGGEHHGTF
jgi:hypothetical protein